MTVATPLGRFGRLTEYLLVTIGLVAAVAVVTWPHAASFGHSVVDHFDPQFSMWRIGWIAHATATGASLVDANTFYPENGTLLLSDSVLLEGALAAPAIWAGASLPLVYNTLMLLGLVSSGVALYYVARVFDVAPPAAFLGAVIFTVAPYRIEHIMHLEIQWVAPAVVSFAALHWLLVAPSWRSAAALGLLAAAQFLACVYYAVFLVPLLAALVLAAVRTAPSWRATVGYGLAAAVLGGALIAPLAVLYLKQSATVGPRPSHDLTSYSATPINYLASPAENVLYGSTADRFGSGERRLFPGTMAVVVAVAGVFSRRRRLVVAACVVLVVSVTLSLGVNAWPYRLLYAVWPVLHGLRAPARYAVFALSAMAMLAALGLEPLLERLRGHTRWRQAAAIAAVLVACVEYRSPQAKLLRADMKPPVYEFLRGAPAGVVLELPFSPRVDGEPDPKHRVDYDSDYIYWSTRHWHPIINGYSGYYPPSYETTRASLEGFPDAPSMAFLAERRVRYVLLHAFFMPPGEAARIAEQLVLLPGVRPLGTYRDWLGSTLVFELIGS